jgi:hypothetical protein
MFVPLTDVPVICKLLALEMVLIESAAIKTIFLKVDAMFMFYWFMF